MQYERDQVLFAVGARYEGVVEQRVGMTVSLEQLAGLEEKEEEEKSGSLVHGSDTYLREY